MRTSRRSRPPSRLGRDAERRVRRHFVVRGYRILATNVWVAGNELDLVARRGRALVFCEVKEKRGDGFGEPADMVTAEKQRRLRRAATAWLVAHPEAGGLDVRFDVVAVAPAGMQRIANAF